jgi:hypothetical protein
MRGVKYWAVTGLLCLGAVATVRLNGGTGVTRPRPTATSGPEVSDIVRYAVAMTLHVPRVYDNTQSLGRRVYRTQRLTGVAVVSHVDDEVEPDVTLCLTNRAHKVDGKCVDYECDVWSARWHVIGDNRTDVFRKASIALELEATPSYIRDADFSKLSADDTLILTLAGSGTKKYVSGYVTGTIGCGCYQFGHVSPTRSLFSWDVVDVAAVYGRFTMRRLKD